MADDDMRAWSFRPPRLDQPGEVPDHRLEAVEPARRLVALRAPLPAPIEGGDVPAGAVPMIVDLEIFLDEIAAPAGEE